MKERQVELTIKHNLTNLRSGENFMPEGGEGPKPSQKETQKPQKMTPEDTVGRLAKIKGEGIAKKRISFPPELEGANVEVKNAYEHYIEDQAKEVERTFTKEGLQSVTIKEGEKRDEAESAEEKYKRWSQFLLQKVPKESLSKYKRRLREASKLMPEFTEEKLKKIAEDISRELDEEEKRISQESSTEFPSDESPQEAQAQAQTGGEGGDGGGEKPPAPPEGVPEPQEEAGEEGFSEAEKEFLKKLGEREAERFKNFAYYKSIIGQVLEDPDLKAEFSKAGINLPSPDDVLKGVSRKDFEEEIMQVRRRAIKEREPIYIPASLEEAAQLVMNRATPEYKLDRGDGQRGEKCILNEDGTVNTKNLLDWARDNYFKVHLNSPTTEVSFFSDIATNIRTEGLGSTIGFYELTFTDSNFLKEVKDEDGNVRLDERGHKVTEENKEYRELQNEMIMEVFLLQLRRNPAINLLLQSQAERDKLLGTLASAFALNPSTRGDFLVRTLTFPSMQGESIADRSADVKGRELIVKKEANFLMGDGARQALGAYMSIYDYRQLVEILGEDAPLFQYEYEKWDSFTAKPKDPSEGKAFTPEEAVRPKYSRKDVWYYTKEDVERLQREMGITVKLGSLKLYGMDGMQKLIPIKGPDGKILNDSFGNPMYEIDPTNGLPHPDFMKRLNFFTTPTPEARDQDEIRERLRLSIMKNNGISYREAQIAELFAYSDAELNGVSAKMDVDAVTFKWWGRLLNFFVKRNRERSPERHSAYGSKFNMEGFKRIGLNALEGIRDVRGRSIQRLILGGEGRNINIREDLKNHVDYERDEAGYIKFVDSNGNEVSGPKVTSGRVVNSNRVEMREEKPGELKPNEVIEAKVEYKDESGNVVDVGELLPKIKIKEIEEKVEFKSDIQKQFIVNHVLTGSRIYELIVSDKGLGLPEIVKGLDSHGNPILDREKINEIKFGPEHDYRYLLSTSGEINFAEESLEPERVYRRNDRRQLIAKRKGPGEKELYLDEDWYILDNRGRRTDELSEPDSFLRSRVMTRMENMFGAPALRYIQAEIHKRGLDAVAEGQEGNEIFVEDPRTGERIRVNLTQAKYKEADFRRAVWIGAFDYFVAADVEAHRTRGSGYTYWNSTQALNAKDALIAGEILEPWEVNFISKLNRITNGWIFSEDMLEAMAFGGGEGLLKSLKIILKGMTS